MKRPLGAGDVDRPPAGARPHRRRRPALGAEVPELPGLDGFAARSFTRRAGTTTLTSPASGSRRSAPGPRRSSSCPRSRPMASSFTCSSARRHGWFPHSNRARDGLRAAPLSSCSAAQRAVRASIYAAREIARLGFAKRPRLMRVIERLARRHMEEQVSDPQLLAKVQPDYSIGCKRILPSNSWYPALGKPNVELVTDGIREVKANSIVGKDGVEREVDAIILGTGFKVTDMPIARLVHGRGGRSLARRLARQPARAPRLNGRRLSESVLLLGPNTGLGHGSMVYMIESQSPTCSTRCRPWIAKGSRRPRSGRRWSVPTTSRSTSGWRGRFGTRAARAGTSTRPAATVRSGRTGPGASGSARRASTPPTTS